MPLGIHGTYSRLGIVLVLTFIGLPFAVRAVQPVLESMEVDAEEAAMLLGANRWQTFWHVILPTLMPAIITGFALSFARAIGEYGSVVFVSSNIQNRHRNRADADRLEAANENCRTPKPPRLRWCSWRCRSACWRSSICWSAGAADIMHNAVATLALAHTTVAVPDTNRHWCAGC